MIWFCSVPQRTAHVEAELARSRVRAEADKLEAEYYAERAQREIDRRTRMHARFEVLRAARGQ